MKLSELYEGFEAKLHRYAMRLVRDSHEAEDLVQKTFLRAMGHIGLLSQLNLHQRNAWLRQTLKNLFLDEQRTRQREQFAVEQLIWQAQIAYQPVLDVVCQDIFNHIPERYRDVLHKRYVLGMNSEEIACEMEVPAATVRSRLHVALKWLRANKFRFL
ncbi:RNA polymerase sigma factor [Candidatus Poribacteria bacterium]|nr:RNA polymerase sigma factor [Candidatus Poribacteria bacterium]